MAATAGGCRLRRNGNTPAGPGARRAGRSATTRPGLGEYAWYAGNSGDVTHPVGQKKPNDWGLYDMHGDVPEWCWDRFDPNYYRTAPLSDPVGGRGETRVYRGGGWNDAAAQTRSASRQSLGQAYGVLTLVGFRLARDAAP